MLFDGYLNRLRNVSLENELVVGAPLNVVAPDVEPTRAVSIQRDASGALQHHFALDGLVPLALNYAINELDHIMTPTKQRLLSSFFAMMNYSVRTLINHDANLTDFPLTVSY